MKWLKKLDNPFLLALQGFVGGALLFFATHPEQVGAHMRAPAAQAETR